MNRFREQRLRAGYKSQADLAKLLFVNQTAVSQWERDVTTPSPPILLKLSQLYGVSTDYLLGKDAATENQKGIKIPVLGDVAAGKKVKKYIEIKNEGRSSLLIRKAVVTTGNGIEVKAPKKIDAGKTAKLQVIITNNVGKVTNISGNVKLITNDPVHTIKNIQVNYNAK